VFGLPVIEIVVIALYFAVIIGIGAWSSRRIKNQEDFFLAGRGFGKLVQTFAAFGQGTNADSAVGVSTTTFTNGASGIWSSLMYLFATPVYWLVAPWMRRLRLLTTGDYYGERYGSKAMAATYAVIGSIGMMGFIALGFNAMTKTIVAITPKTAEQFTDADKKIYEEAIEEHAQKVALGTVGFEVLTYDELAERERLQGGPAESLDTAEQDRLAALEAKAPAMIVSHIRENVLVWLVCFIVMLYAVAGGLQAAFLTDMLQGVFILLLSVILIPFGWAKINEIHGGSSMMDALRIIHRQLPESMFDIFGSPHSIDFTWYYILALSLMAIFTVPVQPNFIVATGSARDEYTARYGFTVGSFLKRFCTVFWGVFGLAALVLYSGKIHNPDLVWGYATRDLLGPLNLGLVGLMIASLMAALMSTADCLMLTCSSLLTHNVYLPLVPGRSQRHYVWAGRVFGAMILIGSVLIATQFDTILALLKFIWEFCVMLAPAFWLGMKWRRANRAGAWASIIIAGMLFFVLPLLASCIPQLRTNEYLLKRTDPAPLVRTYAAHEFDVHAREKEIAAWKQLDAQGRAEGVCPQPLALGNMFQQRYTLPRKSIFWTQGIQPRDDGNLHGCGTLSLELVLLDGVGFDLSQNPHALNETIRILIRTIAPFLIMIIVTLSTRPDGDRLAVDRFFARMRTKVSADRGEDAREVALSLDDVHRHKDRLLFPNSQWEFFKWTREDAGGFFLAVLAVGGVLVVMTVLVSLGE
jgi:SSS family solute:Na+ symporter